MGHIGRYSRDDKKIDHIAIAVKDLDKALKIYTIRTRGDLREVLIFNFDVCY